MFYRRYLDRKEYMRLLNTNDVRLCYKSKQSLPNCIRHFQKKDFVGFYRGYSLTLRPYKGVSLFGWSPYKVRVTMPMWGTGVDQSALTATQSLVGHMQIEFLRRVSRKLKYVPNSGRFYK